MADGEATVRRAGKKACILPRTKALAAPSRAHALYSQRRAMQLQPTTSTPGFSDFRLHDSFRIDARGSGEESMTSAIAARTAEELTRMQGILGEHSNRDEFVALAQWTSSTLERIGRLMNLGLIDPTVDFGNDPGGLPPFLARRAVRLGVFPTAGDPLHWGHLLAGLAAVERFHLDKVIYVIAGDDPRKPAMSPEPVRHLIAREVLGLFSPLFEYSPIALGGTMPGESNLFQIIASSRARPLHAFYLAGSDHYHRFSPQTGNADTIQRLEDGVRQMGRGFGPTLAELTAVFLDRGDHVAPVQSELDVRWIDRLPLQASSTRIRRSLSGEGPLCELTALPFTAYCSICSYGMYRMADVNGAKDTCGFFHRGHKLRSEIGSDSIHHWQHLHGE